MATRDSGALQIAVIVGSIRPNRFCPIPAHWVTAQGASRDDVTIDVIDLAEHDLPALLNGDEEDPPIPVAVQELSQRLHAADAFVVVTPVYNHGYPASLKNAIDWFYDEWAAKPVGFVSYGGTGGGVQAVQQLRPVFAEVHATTIRNALVFADFWATFGDDGTPRDAQILAGMATAFFDQLTWWGRALRRARSTDPYPL